VTSSAQDPADRKRARRALQALEAAGGIVGRVDLAKRWGVSGSRIRHMTAAEDFPEPAGQLNGDPYWLAADVDPWRAAQPKPGRPRKST
jgi:hypothetical protein